MKPKKEVAKINFKYAVVAQPLGDESAVVEVEGWYADEATAIAAAKDATETDEDQNPTYVLKVLHIVSVKQRPEFVVMDVE